MTPQPGVWISYSDTSARLEVFAKREIRYSTLHPSGYVFDRHNTAILNEIGNRAVLAVVDRNIDELYGADIRRYLQTVLNCRGYVLVEGTEKEKNWSQVQLICDEAIRAQLPRDGVIMAVGGGVTLDVAGFAASVFRRGVTYVRIPTSLIGLVDVGVGIKQGINVGQKKSIVGAFYPAMGISTTLHSFARCRNVTYRAAWPRSSKWRSFATLTSLLFWKLKLGTCWQCVFSNHLLPMKCCCVPSSSSLRERKALSDVT